MYSRRGIFLGRCDRACSGSHLGVTIRSVRSVQLLVPCLNSLEAGGRAENKGGASRATVCRTFSRQTTSPIPIRVFDVLISRIMSMPCSILVGSDSLTRNAPLALFRVGVCGRGSSPVRHPCRGGRPDWCGQGIQPWPRESQSPVLATCVCLILHVPRTLDFLRSWFEWPFPGTWERDG